MTFLKYCRKFLLMLSLILAMQFMSYIFVPPTYCPQKKIADYHHVVVSKVRAESQATYLQNIYPLLNDIEKDWVRRGRNAVNKSPRRLPLQTYQAASGFETLLGYLYISEPERLEFLLSHLTDVTQKYN